MFIYIIDKDLDVYEQTKVLSQDCSPNRLIISASASDLMDKYKDKDKV